jgi:hypothetical protein
MILSYKITLGELSKFGKDYKWEQHFCEACARPMWGHGYVSRYFAVLLNSVFLKRYRCPQCKMVVTVRPSGYWPFVRSEIPNIYETLKCRLCTGRWPDQFPRQRGGHWLLKLVRFSQMELQSNLIAFLEHCFRKQIQFLP